MSAEKHQLVRRTKKIVDRSVKVIKKWPTEELCRTCGGMIAPGEACSHLWPKETHADQMHRQERGRGNFRDKNGRLFLVRCYVCQPEGGTENYMLAVSSGQCAWCGWSENLEAA